MARLHWNRRRQTKGGGRTITSPTTTTTTSITTTTTSAPTTPTIMCNTATVETVDILTSTPHVRSTAEYSTATTFTSSSMPTATTPGDPCKSPTPSLQAYSYTISSTGPTAQFYPQILGVYEFYASTNNKFPVFRQTGGSNTLHHEHGRWWVSVGGGPEVYFKLQC